MRRAIVIAAASIGLAGCSSFSMDNLFKSTPPTVQVQLDSTPQGADAKTSLGPGCKTPCTVSVSPPDNAFSVTYTMDKYEPATVPVNVVHVAGDITTPASTNIDPNPVVGELQPSAPPPKHKRAVRHKPKPKTAAAPADGSAPGQTAAAPQQ
jgi:hypothetical protein